MSKARHGYSRIALLLLFVASATCEALGAVTPSPGPTPSVAIVTATCVVGSNDLTLRLWNYLDGYLYCSVADSGTGNGHLFQQQSDGSFKLLFGGGGEVSPADMESVGVPADIAVSLFEGRHP